MWLPATSSAQSIIRVESAGAPVGRADVSVWDADGRLGFGRSDDAGMVRIVLERVAGPKSFILARRLGFAPMRMDYSARDTIVVTLSAVPVRLPVLTVDTKRLRCPAAAEPEAVELWRAVASHYSHGLAGLEIDWTGYVTHEAVPAEQRGFADPYEIRQPYYGHTSEGMSQAGMRDPPPYGLYERHLGLGGEWWEWRYPFLMSYSAEHFVSERFLERHNLVRLGTSGVTTVLGFCPRDDSEAEIEGELQIGPDSLLAAARWQFRVPHDDEDAGGESTFAQATYEGRAYLIGIRGSRWRRTSGNLYNQTRFERTRWKLRAIPGWRAG